MSSILELEDAGFSYSHGGRAPRGWGPFIENLNLNVFEGDFIGLLGANGSGKSTILKLLSGILKPDAGGVRLWGKPLGSYGNRDRAKLVSYLPQVLDMGVPFSVGELAGMGAYPYDIKPLISLDDALALVGLSGKKDALLKNLSGGERRRAFIAMTLHQGAGILLLDEPLANLDIRYQLELIRLLKALNAEKGIAIVMALHDVNLAFQFKRLVLIKEGRLIGDGPPEAVLKAETLKEAFDVEIAVKTDGEGSYISYDI